MQGHLIAQATLWDWGILIVALVSTLSGYWRGFVRLAFGIAGWVTAVLFTVPLTAVVLNVFRQLAISTESTPPTIVMQVLVFLFLLVAGRLVGLWFRKLITALRLGGLDRFCGALFGLARAALIVAIAAMLGMHLGMHQQPAWREALSAEWLDWLAREGLQLLDQYRIRPPDLSTLRPSF